MCNIAILVNLLLLMNSYISLQSQYEIIKGKELATCITPTESAFLTGAEIKIPELKADIQVEIENAFAPGSGICDVPVRDDPARDLFLSQTWLKAEILANVCTPVTTERNTIIAGIIYGYPLINYVDDKGTAINMDEIRSSQYICYTLKPFKDYCIAADPNSNLVTICSGNGYWPARTEK
jgi:hypothetical protein